MTTFALVFVLALVVGWLTAAATSVRSVSRIWLRHWVEQKLAGSAAAELFLDRPQRWLFAAGTGIAATVFAMGAVIGTRAASGAAAATQIVVAIVLLMAVFQIR